MSIEGLVRADGIFLGRCSSYPRRAATVVVMRWLARVGFAVMLVGCTRENPDHQATEQAPSSSGGSAQTTGGSASRGPAGSTAMGLDGTSSLTVGPSTGADATQEGGGTSPSSEGPAPPGSCCAPHGSGGCNDPGVTQCVCDFDKTCCDEWRSDCVELVDTLDCPGDGCGLSLDACCTPHPSGGCGVSTVEECVCDFDSYCCDGNWDLECVIEAVDYCGLWTCSLGDCCTAQEASVPGCDDYEVAACVCVTIEFENCCQTEWDDDCVAVAEGRCGASCP